MKPITSDDGHPALAFELPHKLYTYTPDSQGRTWLTWFELKPEVSEWLKAHIAVGRYQLLGDRIVFLDDSDRFHFRMRWR